MNNKQNEHYAHDILISENTMWKVNPASGHVDVDESSFDEFDMYCKTCSKDISDDTDDELKKYVIALVESE
jgi:hypothetical protein